MIRVVGNGQPPEERPIVFKVVTDPAALAEIREVHEAHRRNRDWLDAHWPDLLPGVLGRHLAVAGQQAFVADSPEEALALARAAHPNDKGLFLQYVPTNLGPRIYGVRG